MYDPLGSLSESTRALCLQIVLVIAFLTMNTILNLYNKWLFTPVEKEGAGLTAPIFATITHSIAGFTTAFVLTFFPSVYVPKEVVGWRQWCQVIAMGFFFACTIGLNNSSLVYLPLSVQQTIRSCSPVALAIAAYFIEHKVYSIQQIIALFFLVGGIVLTVASNDSANPIGVLMAAGSVVSGALYYTFVSLNLGSGGVNMNAIDILLYTSVPVALILTPVFIIADEYNTIAQFSEENGASFTVLLFAIGCVLAVAYNLMTFKFIKLLSAVYLSVVANFKLVLLIIVGVALLGEELTVLSAVGLTIATLAFAYYSYLEYEQKVEKEKEKEKLANDVEKATKSS